MRNYAVRYYRVRDSRRLWTSCVVCGLTIVGLIIAIATVGVERHRNVCHDGNMACAACLITRKNIVEHSYIIIQRLARPRRPTSFTPQRSFHGRRLMLNI